MTEKGKIKFTKTELRSLKGKETRVYLQSVMKKLFQERWEDSYKKLLAGDRDTLDYCASQLKINLDYFPLLHTLCLITARRDDLEEKEPVKAADSWITWYSENKGSLVWDKPMGLWKVGE